MKCPYEMPSKLVWNLKFTSIQSRISKYHKAYRGTILRSERPWLIKNIDLQQFGQ